MSDAAELGDFFFEGGAFAAQDKLLRGHHALDGRSNLSTDRCVLRGKIKLRHGLQRVSKFGLRGHGFAERLVYVICVLPSGEDWLQNCDIGPDRVGAPISRNKARV